ncbi:MAG TPA: hypothetical protein VGM91_06950 [Conexibacter sp.]|jgi:hypothetical protein
MTEVLTAAFILGYVFVPGVICALKGKPSVAIHLGGGAIGCAFKLALPKSWWARQFYSEETMLRARARYAHLEEPPDEELLAAWDGVEIDQAKLDSITRRALRRAGRI